MGERSVELLYEVTSCRYVASLCYSTQKERTKQNSSENESCTKSIRSERCTVPCLCKANV
jgi:hypothetical protein